MDIRDRQNLLMDASEQLNLAIDNIRVALRDTSFESHANAYIIPHLVSWDDSNNPFNMGIQQYIGKLNEEEIES